LNPGINILPIEIEPIDQNRGISALLDESFKVLNYLGKGQVFTILRSDQFLFN
jgi:hypothetical protein